MTDVYDYIRTHSDVQRTLSHLGHILMQYRGADQAAPYRSQEADFRRLFCLRSNT